MTPQTRQKKARASKTKIIATIGPASNTREKIKAMADAGMSCARINTAHGDFEQYSGIIDLIRECADIPVLIDIKGPEIRLRLDADLAILPKDEVEFGFRKGELPYFSFDFSSCLEKGDSVFFDNGMLEAKVLSVRKGSSARLSFDDEYVLKPNKGVNIPGKELDIPSLSDKDNDAVKFAISKKLSFIALSFTRYAEDVIALRKMLGDSGIGIIAKIENHEGVENIDEIIEASDGVMIARGDLGVELPVEKIPFIQKTIIKKCNDEGKIVIVATQMLESMTASRSATRAEVSDVANAVLDGADAVMLSGETASGKYPVEAVKVMRKIAYEVEDKIGHNVEEAENRALSQKISEVANHLATDTDASKIICLTRSGFSARQIARYKPKAQIIAVTDSQEACLQLKLVWGVEPVIAEIPLRAIMPTIADMLLEKKLIERDDLAVFVGGIRTLEKNVSNVVEIHQVQELLDYHKKMQK